MKVMTLSSWSLERETDNNERRNKNTVLDSAVKIIKQGSVFAQQITFGPIFRWGAREELCRDDV